MRQPSPRSDSRGLRAFGVLAIGVSVALAPAYLRAETDVIAFHWVRGESAESCPAAEEMAASIALRLGTNPFRDVDAHRSLEGWAERKGGAFHLHLVFRRADGTVGWTRDLSSEAGDCRSVSDAAALVVAALLAPDLPATEDASAPPDAELADAGDAPVEGPARKVERARERDASGPPPAALRAGMIEARAVAAAGLLPAIAPGIEIATVVPLRFASVEVAGLWLSEARTKDDRFAFGLTGLSAGPCADFSPTARVILSLCGALAAGVVHGVVHRVEPSRPGERLWLGLAAGPRARLKLVGSLHVAAGLTMMINVLRYDFVMLGADGRDIPIFEQPLLGGVAHGALGASFR